MQIDYNNTLGTPSKTLFVSDLDGTLLNTQAELSASTAGKLNELIDRGVCFSAATARTWATVRFLMQDVHLTLPVVLMNGVCIYDPVKERYVHADYIGPDAAKRLLDAMKRANVRTFLYKILDDQIHVYYDKAGNQAMEEFMEERRRKYNKVFNQVSDLETVIDEHVVYFCMLDDKEKLDPVYEEAIRDPALHVEYYQDIYSKELYYLEVCASKASKAGSVRWLKEAYGFEHLVVFGDNLNDLPMFRVADESYAVSNAVPAVKEAADGVIGSNMEDGVPVFMKGKLDGLF